MSLEKLSISILIAIFQGFAATETIFKQLPNNKTKKDKIIFNLIICIYCIISFFFIPNQLRFILCILIITAILYFVLGIRDKVVILYSFNAEIILAICEIIISILMVIIGFDSTKIVNVPKYNLLANVFIATLSIVIVNISLFQKLLRKEINLFQKKNLTIYLYIFLVLLYLIVSKNGLEFLLESNYYLNILFIVLVLFIFVIIMKNERKYEQLKEENMHMYNHVTKYEKIITQQGKANHEFKNQLMVIRGYAQMNSKKLIEYIDSVVEDSRQTQSSYLIKQLNNFPEGGIKGLLYYKLSIIEEECIKYDLNIELGIKNKLNNLPITMYKNITKILGVILDNAIEASKVSKEKKILICVTKEKNNVIFTIQNTYRDNIEISKLGTGYTNKGIGRGYGLRLVNDIINESNYFELDSSVDDKYFITKLKINISSKIKKVYK